MDKNKFKEFSEYEKLWEVMKKECLETPCGFGIDENNSPISKDYLENLRELQDGFGFDPEKNTKKSLLKEIMKKFESSYENIEFLFGGEIHDAPIIDTMYIIFEDEEYIQFFLLDNFGFYRDLRNDKNKFVNNYSNDNISKPEEIQIKNDDEYGDYIRIWWD